MHAWCSDGWCRYFEYSTDVKVLKQEFDFLMNLKRILILLRVLNCPQFLKKYNCFEQFTHPLERLTGRSAFQASRSLAMFHSGTSVQLQVQCQLLSHRGVP